MPLATQSLIGPMVGRRKLILERVARGQSKSRCSGLMTENEKAAYAAGLFDGEGNVDIRYRTTHGGKYDRFELRISVVQLATNVLDWMVENFGGSYHTRGRRSRGPLRVSAWVLTGPRAHQFLVKVRPYLIVKAAQAEIALELGEMGDTKRHWFGPGKKGFHRMPDSLWNSRRDVMHRLREQRVSEGVRPKRRNTLPPPRAIQGVPQ